MKKKKNAKGKFGFLAVCVLLAVLVVCISMVSYRSGLKLLHPMEYGDMIDASVKEFGVQKSLVLAVIKTESAFQPDAESHAGAQGLMQITPETFTWLQSKLHADCEPADIFKPEIAIRFGTFFLKYLLDEFEDKETALAAYHAGRGQVHKWLRDKTNSADGKTLTYIPSAETAHYVNKVLKAENRYQNLYSLS